MTDQGRRVGMMFSALTARERVLLILRAITEGGEADPAVRFTMPDEQAQEFNHYIFLMNGVNCDLGTFTAYLSAMVGQLSLRLGWLITVALLIDCGDKGLEQRWSKIETALTETLVDGIAQNWQQVKAVEAVVEEVRKEFGGEDPCVPFIRSKLDEAKSQLEEIHERLRGLDVAVEPPEISDADLAVPRGNMQHAERLYE
jgi:hypothetical protein